MWLSQRVGAFLTVSSVTGRMAKSSCNFRLFTNINWFGLVFLSSLHLLSIINARKDIIWFDSMDNINRNDSNWILSNTTAVYSTTNNVTCASNTGITILNPPSTSKYNVSFYLQHFSNTECPSKSITEVEIYNDEFEDWERPTSHIINTLNGDRYTWDCSQQINDTNCEYSLPITVRLSVNTTNEDTITLKNVIENFDSYTRFTSACNLCSDGSQTCCGSAAEAAYLCTHIGSLSYITRWTNVMNYSNLSIKYQSDGACELSFSANNGSSWNVLDDDDDECRVDIDETDNIQNLGIRFRNNNQTQKCVISHINLFGDIKSNLVTDTNHTNYTMTNEPNESDEPHEPDTDNNEDSFMINTGLIASISGGTTVFICCCLFLICYWRLKQVSEKEDDETAPGEREKSIESSKFRRLFGLDESSRRKTGTTSPPYNFTSREKHKGHDSKVMKSNSTPIPMPMPKIGNVTSENAMRALRIGNRTPGGPNESRSKDKPMPKLSLQLVDSNTSTKSAPVNNKVDKDESWNNGPGRMHAMMAMTLDVNNNGPGAPKNRKGGSMHMVDSNIPDNMYSNNRYYDNGQVNRLGIIGNKKPFEMMSSEGKKDVVIVERGFQHKNTYSTHNDNDNQYSNNDYGYDNDETSESHTAVLVSEIVGSSI